MPKICYTPRVFSKESEALIGHANRIISSYLAQGYRLTLRQLYYQFVSRDLLANTERNYKRLGSVINDARLAGLIDWDSIEDRTRNLHKLSSWENPAEIVAAVARQYREDLWATQDRRVEVWIEKEALAGVFEPICDELRVPFFACRGYTSQSEMWNAGQRIQEIAEDGKEAFILHFGDHDPSGIDMTRDIIDRLTLFAGGIELRRLALNMEQVEEYDPPPNPAKTTDSRFASYIQVYGDQSWELDALEPSVLTALVRDAVEGLRDEEAWDQAVEKEEKNRNLLGLVSAKWEKITRNLKQ
jgi:hypothetical protein